MHNIEYKRWLGAVKDEELKNELLAIAGDENEIKERFSNNLAFGTAGLRGVLGAGTYRMNTYTVKKATQGLAAYIVKNGGNTCAIAYDSRIKSDVFARCAAGVLAANGVKVYIYSELMPTPMLSYAVRELGCFAGIMITASHNPAKYNGYKAYGADGCQMTSESADAVYAEIEALDIFADIKELSFEQGLANGQIEYIGEQVINNYFERVRACQINAGCCSKTNLKVVFTPLNGTGNKPVRRILSEIGCKSVSVVAQQELPDGTFKTCPYPNPELEETVRLGLEQAEREGADLLIATDPDADRAGVAVKGAGGYVRLTGNEIGILLANYIACERMLQGTLPKGALMVKSIVTSDLATAVANNYGIAMKNVLTGFKYIGETILELEAKGEENRFVFGFEESSGYLPGTYVRDKDAVAAAMLICEMAGVYKLRGTSLYAELQAIYEKYGRYLNRVDSYDFEGLAGMQKLAALMQTLRANVQNNMGEHVVEAYEDYAAGTKQNMLTGAVEKITLPKADIVIYRFVGGASAIIRPSGTEPKLKIYYTVSAKTAQMAEAAYAKLSADVKALLKL